MISKLIWGCTVFYPFVYPIGAWTIASNVHVASLSESCQLTNLSFQPSFQGHPISTFAGPITFIIGYTLARGANNQKYHFKVCLVPVELREKDLADFAGKSKCQVLRHYRPKCP